MNPLALIAAILQHPQGGQFLQHLLMLHQNRQQQGQQGGGMYGNPIQTMPVAQMPEPWKPSFGPNPPSADGIPGAQGPWGNLAGASNINEGGGTSNLLPGMRRGEPGGPIGLAGPSTTFYGNPGLNGMVFGGASAGDPSNGLSALSMPTPDRSKNSYAAGSTQNDFGMYGGSAGPGGRMW